MSISRLEDHGTPNYTGGGDNGALLRLAVSNILAAGGGSLGVGGGVLSFTDRVQLLDEATGNRVNLVGAGVGNTQFKCSNAAAQLAFGDPFVDFTVESTGTTTTKIYSAAALPSNITGKKVIIPIAGTDSEKTIASQGSDGGGAFLTVTSAFASPPTDNTIGSIVAFSAVRGAYAGHFSINGNNIATNPLYIGRGASKKIGPIRVYDSALDGIVIEAMQNGCLDQLESIDAAQDNLVVRRGAGNLLFNQTLLSTGGRSNLHIYQGGPTTQPSVNDKLVFVGPGPMEDGKAGGAFVASVWIEHGTTIQLENVTINNKPGFATTAAVRLQRGSNPFSVSIHNGQIDAKDGHGIDCSGGSAAQKVTVTLTGAPKYRGGTEEFIRARDANVLIQQAAYLDKTVTTPFFVSDVGTPESTIIVEAWS